MSNFMFMSLFPEETQLTEGVITQVREREGLAKEEDFGDLYEALRKIREDYPNRVKEVLGDITAGYDDFVEGAVTIYPATTDVYWQHYRRNQAKGSMTMFPDGKKSDAVNDDIMATNYRALIEVMAKVKEEPIIPFNTEPELQLLERQSERALGIGVYVFKNGTEHPIESVWDLRELRIPRFQYRG